MNDAVSTESLDQNPDILVLMDRLTGEKALAALWFSTAVAEEVGKTDSNNIRQ